MDYARLLPARGDKLKGSVKYYGGPDIGNSSGWADGNKASVVPSAIDACISNSDGFFVFDLCHIRSNNYWNAFRQGIDSYLQKVK